MMPVIIIGPGIAGLVCARKLADAGMAPLVLDKGRGIGGRVATRRSGDVQFDHGAQYVNGPGTGFSSVLAALEKAGTLTVWADGMGRTHKVGVPGMSALPKALGAGLDIRQNTQVLCLVPDAGGLLLHLADGTFRAASVVATVPAPQVAALLGADHPLVADLDAVRIAPCLTLMAAVAGPAAFTTRKNADDPLAWIAQDSAKPGQPQKHGALWVAQASEAFSTAHLEDDPATLTARMLPLLCDRLGISAATVTHASTHRWRYARVTQPLGQSFLCSDDGRLYLGGDWCLGARIEAAWDSGTTIAADLLARR